MQRQGGFITLPGLFLAGMAVVVIVAANAIVPQVLEHQKVVSSFKTLYASDEQIKKPRKKDIVEKIRSNWEGDGPLPVNESNIAIEWAKDHLTVSLDYEQRVHVYGNMDFILTWQRAFSYPRN